MSVQTEGDGHKLFGLMQPSSWTDGQMEHGPMDRRMDGLKDCWTDGESLLKKVSIVSCV